MLFDQQSNLICKRKLDANSAYESFVNKFSKVYNKSIPTKPFNLSVVLKNHVATLCSLKAF